jgi:hypothetical protein
MSDHGAGFRDDEEIAARLCAAILGGEDDFTAELYGVETVVEPKLRELVEMARDESSKLIKIVREKVEARSCEVVHKARQASNLILHLRANGDMLFEAFVDDIYENEGRLLTRDVLKFRPLEPIEDDETDEATPPKT